jgi:hypothetical protein
MLMRAGRLSALGAAATIALSGCGVTNPYHATARSRPPVSVAPGAPPDGDADGPPRPRWPVAVAGATPEGALARYAEIYLNWDAGDVVAHQRELAAISLGEARGQAQLAAAHARAAHRQLEQTQITNSGQPIAIAHGSGPAAGQWVIVTSETTRGQGAYQGLPATLHIIYARVTHTPQGWVVVGWQPQN